MTNHELMLSIIEQLVEKGGYENFAVISLSKDYYVQLSAEKGDSEIYCEAVSNNYLPEGQQLSEAQIQELTRLNWHPPTSPQENYSNKFTVNSPTEKNELVNYLIETASSVYGCSIITQRMVELNLE